MPTAECLCRDCGHPFRHLTFKGDAVDPACPVCQGRDIAIKADATGFMAEPGMGARFAPVPKGPS